VDGYWGLAFWNMFAGQFEDTKWRPAVAAAAIPAVLRYGAADLRKGAKYFMKHKE